MREAVCAFANDLPGHGTVGVVFVGVDDGGQPIGLDVTDELLLSLAGMRSDGNILPIPTMAVEKRRLRGHDVAVIVVAPADAPPVKYRGRTWIRVGPRRGIASHQDERILNERRRFRDLAFDLQPIPSATLSDLSKRLFEEEYLPSAFARDAPLAEAMKTLGFVQRFGVGIATANRALAANGNPPLAWEVDDRYVLAVVRRRP